MPVESAAAATSATPQSTSQAASTRLTADYESFLKLLTAQVSNQDPLEPMDSTKFVSQLAQLSQVEQSIQTNTNLESINAHLAASGALADMELIGREVTVAGSAIELRDGSAEFEYELEEAAGNVSARVLAEDGTLIREIEGLSGAPGEVHRVAWDGLDRQGLPVPDARFDIEIEAETAEGDELSASTYTRSTVEELTFEGGSPVLLLSNGAQVPSGSVIAIR